MIFNAGGDYYHPMDRDYLHNDAEVEKIPGMGVKDIGMSVPMGIGAQNIQGLASHIRMGVGAIEIQFPGAVRGQRNAQTPEMYGEEQRTAMRELAKVNEINLTTHSSMGIMGLAGFTGDNPYNAWFTKEQRKISMDEVKRAIDFARDVAGGGSVVVHTGEVERPISEEPWARREDGSYRFKHFEEEPEHARLRVVDLRTGHVMQQVRKNVKIARPKWLRAEHDYEGTDTQGNTVFIRRGDYVDYENRKIPEDLVYDPEFGRVPEYDNRTGRFINELYDWNKILKETEERNKMKRKTLGRELRDEEVYLPEEIYLRSTMETNEGHSRGWALQYGHDTDRTLEQLEKLRKAKKFYEELESKVPVDEQWKIMKQDLLFGGAEAALVPPDVRKPTEIINRRIEEVSRRLEFARQASSSQELQAEDSRETQENLISATKYARVEAAKSYAEAGIHAMDQSKYAKKPIFITLENIFPERYGGHPEELRQLIRDAREEMVARISHRKIKDPSWKRDKDGNLLEVSNPYYRGIPEEEARKMAERHIKATLDTGHINTWRKYWQDDPHKTPQENEQEFGKWILTEVEKLAKDKMIGNVHLSDNLGYQDDHLAPGQGTTPIKDIVKILKKYGYDERFTVEPGADATTNLSAFHGLMTTWRHFGSPIYGFSGGMTSAQGGWQDVQYGYFGRTRPPYYVFGAYAPSNDWTLWSQVPLE